MDASISIRRWRPEDVAHLAVLSGELGYRATADQIARRLAEMSVSSTVLVAAENDSDSVVGWIELAVVTHLTSDPHLEICGLVVSEAARSRGIGGLLVRAAEKTAIERHIGHLRVRSNIVRDRAHGFYERLGFVNVKTSKVFEKAL